MTIGIALAAGFGEFGGQGTAAADPANLGAALEEMDCGKAGRTGAAITWDARSPGAQTPRGAIDYFLAVNPESVKGGAAAFDAPTTIPTESGDDAHRFDLRSAGSLRAVALVLPVPAGGYDVQSMMGCTDILTAGAPAPDPSDEPVITEDDIPEEAPE